MITCGYCGSQFDEAEAEKACRACPMSGCRLVRCPRCGYEALPEPRWIGRVKKWVHELHETTDFTKTEKRK